MIKVRFAPSPTGYLHIGGARTALYNWLYAKNQGGKFLLRIEDTDTNRSKNDMITTIIDSLKWLGLMWDNEIIYQSKRLDRYKEIADLLIGKGLAYKCYCSQETIKKKREMARKNGTFYKYDGTCRNLKNPPKDKPYVIRFKLNEGKNIHFKDIIYGDISVSNSELDDFIIIRSNGLPTYNFAVVVDDIDSEITHIIRGSDHLSNTPKQINIYQALNKKIPKFVHLPMINGPDGKKLSKRHGATSVSAYRNYGILPEAMVNYLARLGWSHGNKEFFTIPELIKAFSLKKINKSPAIFDIEKLYWLNSKHMKISDTEKIYKLVRDYILENNLVEKKSLAEKSEGLKYIISLAKSRHKTINKLSNAILWLFEEFEYDNNIADKLFRSLDIDIWIKIYTFFTNLTDYSVNNIEKEFMKFLKENKLSLKDTAQPLRYALTSSLATPGLFDVIYSLGKRDVLSRIEAVIEYLK